jgi:gluconokinase
MVQAASGGSSAPLVVVMGVSGAGKTTVAAPLAAHLGVDYGEADDFHPPSNVAKMASGRPLDDGDREPWLRAIGAWLAAHEDRGAVATCSALKRRYRDMLRAAAPETVFLHLTGDRDVIEERMGHRSGHFMPTSLLTSQLQTLEPLEPDEAGLEADLTQPPEVIVAEFVTWWKDRKGAEEPRA